MRKYRIQEPPLSISLELTEGCSLRCSFCGIAAIQEKQGKGYKFMSEEVMQSAMSQVAALGWNSRIGFAMRGDPTIHPEFAKMVWITHQHRPRSTKLMLTNAGGLLRKPGPVQNIKNLFDAGLNVLGLDHYQGVAFVPKVLDAIEKEYGTLKSNGEYCEAGFNFWEYPQEPEGNPHKRRKPSTRMLVRIRDIVWTEQSDKKGNHNRLSNHAGSGAPPNDSMQGKRCVLPFRQLAIHQNGDVATCCNDWKTEYYCGNILKEGVEAIWNGPAFGASREALYAGRRDMLKPCAGCDHRSYRVGLLPDLLGKGKMHKPDKQTLEDIRIATEKGPRTTPVLRPWEKAT